MKVAYGACFDEVLEDMGHESTVQIINFECDSDRIEFAKALLEDCDYDANIVSALASLSEIET